MIRIPSISAKAEHKADIAACAERWKELLLQAGADHAEDAEINGSRNHNPIVMLIIVFVPVMQLYPAQRGYEYRQRKIPA